MKNARGFSLVEGLLIFVIVGLVGGTGWYVFHAKNAAFSNYNNSSKESTVNEVTPNKLNNNVQKLLSNSNTTKPVQNSNGSDSEPSIEKTGDQLLSYTTRYDKLKFSYPSTWSLYDYAQNLDYDDITLTSPDKSMAVSLISGNIAEPTDMCYPLSVAEPDFIHEVQPLGNGTPTKTYLIKYTGAIKPQYGGGLRKGMSIVDWHGKTPEVGQSDSCNYAPAFDNTNHKRTWFTIEPRSLGDSDKMSYDDFFNQEAVKQAEAILKSGKYTD